MLTPRFELFDHTADLGVRAWAPSLPELVPPSTDGLYAAIGEVAVKERAVARQFVVTGSDPALLLRDYLAELLDLFYCARRRVTDVRALEFTDQRLVVAGQARPIDDAASDLVREVKAVTYHALAVRAIPGGYEATFIVDI